MKTDKTMDHLERIKFHAEKHEVINVSDFSSEEEYVLHLMHQADYERAAELAKNLKVLDLGCNCGYGSSIIAKTCQEVIGVDVSLNAIESAIQSYESSIASFQVVDGIALPFSDHSFDLVTSFQVIEHLVDHNAYFEEIRRVLKPEGLLLISTPNAAIRLYRGQKPWNPFHVREFWPKEFLTLLESNFASTCVFGQFATNHTYMIEHNRCTNIRGSHPNIQPLLIRLVRKIKRLTIRCIGKFRNLLETGVGKKNTGDYKTKHSVNSFYYQNTNLDQSLSLLACCSATASVVATAENIFQRKP